MTNYTPTQLEAWAGLGPWCAHETKWDVWDVVEIYDLNAGCDDDPIAHLYRVNPWPEGAAADAFRDDKTNAALIAAAPELARLVLEKEKEIAELKTLLAQAGDAIEGRTDDLDERICCNGHQCGCMGATNRSFLLYHIRQAMKETSDDY